MTMIRCTSGYHKQDHCKVADLPMTFWHPGAIVIIQSEDIDNVQLLPIAEKCPDGGAASRRMAHFARCGADYYEITKEEHDTLRSEGVPDGAGHARKIRADAHRRLAKLRAKEEN